MAYNAQLTGLLGRKIRPRYQLPQYNWSAAQANEQRKQFAASMAQQKEQDAARIDLGKQQLAQNLELYNLGQTYDKEKTALSQRLQTQYQNKLYGQTNELAALTRRQNERQAGVANMISLGGMAGSALIGAKQMGWLPEGITAGQTAWQYGVPALAGAGAGYYLGSKKGRTAGMLGGASAGYLAGGLTGGWTGGGGMVGAAVGAIAGYMSKRRS